MAPHSEATPGPAAPEADVAPRSKRNSQRQKYRQRKKAEQKAADGDRAPQQAQPASRSTKDPAVRTPRDVSNVKVAPNEQPSTGEVKLLSAVGNDQPKGSATNTSSKRSDTGVAKKTQHQGPEKMSRPQSKGRGDEQRPGSAAVALPELSPALQNGVVPRDMKITGANVGSKIITTTTSDAGTADIAPSDAPGPDSSAASLHSAVVDQPLDNLYTMIRQQREKLFEGPFITIHIGKRSVTSIYKRVAMASSLVINKHFTDNPESLDFNVQGYIAPEAVEYMLVTWMKDIRHEFEVIAMPLQSSFSNNVAILRAARYLGMEKYAKWILTKHVEYLREWVPSYEEVALVERNRSSDHDPIWTFMVNHLSHARYQGYIPDPEDFVIFLAEHPALSTAMDVADAFFAGRVEKARRERWEQNEAERMDRVAREQEVSASLSRKLEDKSGSGLLLVSEAEAALLRGR